MDCMFSIFEFPSSTWNCYDCNMNKFSVNIIYKLIQLFDFVSKQTNTFKLIYEQVNNKILFTIGQYLLYVIWNLTFLITYRYFIVIINIMKQYGRRLIKVK